MKNEVNILEQYYNTLSHCALFNDIKVDEYSSLLPCINYNIKSYKSNEYLFFAGDKINFVGIVLSGSLEIIKENPAGAKHIVDFLGPSNVFAEGIVCTPMRLSPVSVRTKEASTVLFIPFERILNTCSSSCLYHTSLIKNMMMLLGEKNFTLNRKIELLNLKGMREKLATYLLYESKKQNALTFQIIPNRNELAEFLNVSRTSMCRELARMKEEGMLDYYLNSFKIISINELKKCITM